MTYNLLRNLHLFCGLLSLPFLLMYGISAVQMAHSKWFSLKPVISERTATVAPNLAPRAVKYALALPGEIRETKVTNVGSTVRVQLPGTVHDVTYNRLTGETKIRTSVGGTLAMMNRLHHAAGMYQDDYLPLRLWGAAVAIVSAALLGMGLTGLMLWWQRRRDRAFGLLLLGANVVFTLGVLLWVRSAGP